MNYARAIQIILRCLHIVINFWISAGMMDTDYMRGQKGELAMEALLSPDGIVGRLYHIGRRSAILHGSLARLHHHPSGPVDSVALPIKIPYTCLVVSSFN